MEPISSRNVITDLNLLAEAAEQQSQDIQRHTTDRFENSEEKIDPSNPILDNFYNEWVLQLKFYWQI